MKRVAHSKKGLVISSLFLIISLILSSCEDFTREVQKQLDPIAQQQIEILKETQQAVAGHLQATIQAQAQAVQATALAKGEQLPGEVAKQAGNLFQSAKEWLGLASPSNVGVVTIAINPQSSKAVIESAFKDAYQRAGGAKSIGYPDDLVHRQGSDLLVQNFKGGSQNRCVLVMRDGEDQAFYLPGDWLQTYDSLGGFSRAGYPISDPKDWGVPNWQVWNKGRGQRQLFESESGEYALMKATGSDSIKIVPPDIWLFYEQNDGVGKIGYPLSSYPLQDDQWNDDNRISDSTKVLLARWEQAPFRAQIFEKGGILINRSHTRFELVEEKQRYGVILKDAHFMNDLSTILLGEYENRNGLFQEDTCFFGSLQHAGFMANSDALTTALSEVPKVIISAILSGSELAAESAYAKISLFAAEVILEKSDKVKWTDTIYKVMAGEVLESIYAAGIGEILSKPAAKVSELLLQSEYDQITRDRYTNGIRTTPGHTYLGFSTTMDVTLVVTYDPLLNMVTGVITSKQCNSGTYAFFFKFDPGGLDSSGHVAPDEQQVWDGRVHFIDLGTGQEIH